MLRGLETEEAVRLQLNCEIAFWSLDLETRSCQVGPGWQKWIGQPEEFTLNSLAECLELVHPVDRAEVEALLLQPPTRRAVELAIRLRHTDRSWRWLRFKGRALDGKKVIVGLAEEVTRQKGQSLRAEERRKAAEEALRSSEELYRGLYEQSTEHLFSVQVDSEGGFRYEGINPAHQRATGLRESDLKGKRPHECLPEAVANHVERNYRRCLESEQIVTYEEELNLPKGRINWLTQLIPLRQSDGRIGRLFGICTDLTRLKDQEKALRLVQRQESIGRLTSGIAHDFNNLLTVILCQLELMEKELKANPEMVELLGEIGEAARHAAELTRGLLTYSSKNEGSYAPQSVAHLVTQFQRVLKNLVGPRVELRYELETTAAVMGAPLQIIQLLLNLVGNAAEAMGQPGGTITVRVAEQALGDGVCQSLFPGQNLQPGNYLTLEVSDTGPGIPDHIVASIFESGVSTKGEGRGLGLATVRQIVGLLNGGLSVHSSPEKGTSFKLFFPQVPTREANADEAVAVAAGPLNGRVLICAEETSLRRTLKELCASLGLDGQETTGAPEFLSILARDSQGFELAVLDVVDKVTQDQVLAALPALKPDLKVLLLSQLSAGELLLGNAYPAPAAFLAKPFARADFKACLGRLLPG